MIAGNTKRLLALGVVVVLGVVLAALIVVVLYSDDADGGLDPARAKELSRAALISAPDLPGGGWRSRTLDQFDEDQSNLPHTPACEEQRKLYGEVLKFKDNLADRSQRGLELGTNPVQAQVEEWVEVYTSSTHAKRLVPHIERQMGDSMVVCTTDSYGNTGIKAKRVQPRVEPPSGGRAIAMELTAPNQFATRRSEYYYWRFGNVGVSLTFNGPSERITTELVRTAIERAEENLRSAANR